MYLLPAAFRFNLPMTCFKNKLIYRPKSRIPKRLAERLGRKFVPTAKKDARLRTPLIFREDTKRPFRIRYKPEEFGLAEDEEFVSARQFLNNLKSTLMISSFRGV